MDALLDQYIIESRECLQLGAAALLELEKTPAAPAYLDQLFRSLHTVKGGAGLFVLTPVIRTTHAAEDVLDSLRDNRINLTPALFNLLFAVIDQITEWIDALETRQQLTDNAEAQSAALVDQLDQYRSRTDAVPGTAPAPAADTSWIAKLTAETWLDSADRTQSELTAIAYTPDSGCFFSGEDPLNFMRLLPGLCALHIEPVISLPPLAQLDIYACQLKFYALSRAEPQVIGEYCAYLAQQIVLAPAAHAAPAQHSKTAAEQDVFYSIMQAQLQILNLPDLFSLNLPRLKACLHAIRNVLSFMQQHNALLQFDALARNALQQNDARGLRQFLADLVARQQPAPAETDAAKPQQNGKNKPSSKFIKVEQARIDQLIDLIAEMAVAKNGLLHISQQLQGMENTTALARYTKDRYASIERIVSDMKSIAMEVRMIPMSTVFQRLPRLVRDLSHQLGKKVNLVISGEETQADKNIMEVLAEPLMHIVRNSLSHGIEPAAERAGKPAVGTIEISAAQHSDNLIITVTDDGRGIDPGIIRDRALHKKILGAADMDRRSDREILNLIFLPGFSTTDEISDVSGRGVGMDVVKSAIENAGGSVAIASELGSNTTITLLLPLAILVSHVMTVKAADQLFGVPLSRVRQSVRLPVAAISKVKNRDSFVLHDEIIPLLRLRTLLDLPPLPDTRGELAILLVQTRHGKIGVAVDDFSNPLEVIIKPMDGILRALGNYEGTALQADGTVLLILNIEGMINAHQLLG